MNCRTLIAVALTFPLFGALAGVATADSLFPDSSHAQNPAISDEKSAPAAVTITVRTSNTAQTVAYLDEPTSFTVPVYFSLNDTSISREAELVLIALADEAAAAPFVSITVSARGPGLDEGATLRDMRAMTVFDRLNELGVPDRTMALELEQGPGATLSFGVVTNAI